jgi:hypothetical protein
MTFAKWLDTFISEKGINPETGIEVEGASGANHMPATVVFDAMKAAPAHEQAAIKTTFVKIDFANGDPIHFVRHLAGVLAI